MRIVWFENIVEHECHVYDIPEKLLAVGYIPIRSVNLEQRSILEEKLKVQSIEKPISSTEYVEFIEQKLARYRSAGYCLETNL